ncbi:MAG: hypothetical protein AAF393_13090 [Pseudomonadota bacterium]
MLVFQSRIVRWMLVASVVLAGVQPAQADKAWLHGEIRSDGAAKFIQVERENRKLLWTVTCRMPLRGCVGRGQGLIAWVDVIKRPHLVAAAPPGARISVIWRNQIQDMPKLFGTTLSRENLSTLSRQGAELIIEKDGRILQKSQTFGLDQLFSYLSWLKSNKAKTGRDARAWRIDETAIFFDANPTVLARHRILDAQRTAQPRILVPSTKPQAEFAIGSQNGASFFVERQSAE